MSLCTEIQEVGSKKMDDKNRTDFIQPKRHQTKRSDGKRGKRLDKVLKRKNTEFDLQVLLPFFQICSESSIYKGKV